MRPLEGRLGQEVAGGDGGASRDLSLAGRGRAPSIAELPLRVIPSTELEGSMSVGEWTRGRPLNRRRCHRGAHLIQTWPPRAPGSGQGTTCGCLQGGSSRQSLAACSVSRRALHAGNRCMPARQCLGMQGTAACQVRSLLMEVRRRPATMWEAAAKGFADAAASSVSPASGEAPRTALSITKRLPKLAARSSARHAPKMRGSKLHSSIARSQPAQAGTTCPASTVWAASILAASHS